MLDLESLLDELEKVMVALLNSPDGKITVREVRDSGAIKVTSNLSIRLGLQESLGERIEKERPTQGVEPLIDVFETPDGPKVVIALPGIRKEDVRFGLKGGSLEVEITRGESVFRKEIPCAIRPRSIRVKSIVENNSVLEISLAKRRNRKIG